MSKDKLWIQMSEGLARSLLARVEAVETAVAELIQRVDEIDAGRADEPLLYGPGTVDHYHEPDLKISKPGDE